MNITQERFNELLKTEARVIDLEIENKRLERYIELYKERAAMASEMTIKEEKEDEMLTLEQAAEWLGINRITLWRWSKEGRIAIVSLGRHKRVKKSDLKKFVERNTKTNA